MSPDSLNQTSFGNIWEQFCSSMASCLSIFHLNDVSYHHTKRHDWSKPQAAAGLDVYAEKLL